MQTSSTASASRPVPTVAESSPVATTALRLGVAVVLVLFVIALVVSLRRSRRAAGGPTTFRA